MNKLFNFLIIPILALISLTSFSQEEHFNCGLNHELEKLYAKNPNLKADQAKFLAAASQHKSEKGLKSLVYTIPVVFHIIHQYGIENISDAQVIDQMEILNRDYRMRNSDTSDIIPEFKKIKAEAFMEFKLATKDPQGNCTNGINHIYSSETMQGSDAAKLNGWSRSKYLNVWVIGKMEGNSNTAGFSRYPTAVAGFNFVDDGVILLHNFIGKIGTGSDRNSRALTHEIGHWLGLPHLWGNTNDPGDNCTGDDGIADTPKTKGHTSCSNSALFTPTCTISSLDSTYNFNGVILTSALTDPTPVPTTTSGAIFGSFKSVGVSSNPDTLTRFSYTDWPIGGIASNNDTTYANLTGVIDTSKYYEVKLTPKFGNNINLSKINFTFQRNATGPRTYSVRIKDGNGFSSNLLAVSNNTALKIKSTNVFYSIKDTVRPLTGSQINLAIVNSSPAITFRIYAWNAEDNLGSFSIDNFTITGSEGVIDNVQNYMEYSYCSNMYTKDQVSAMRYSLESDVASRNKLITTANSIATGIDAASTATCAPLADFKSDLKAFVGAINSTVPRRNSFSICKGGNVVFTDVSSRAIVDSRVWTFEDGTPATSTTASQTVVFDTPGYKKVTLSVTNAVGTDTKTEEKYVFVSNAWSDYTGPSFNTLDTDSKYFFQIQNEENNEAQFALASGKGYPVSGVSPVKLSDCFKLNNYKDISKAPLYSSDFYYNQRMAGRLDAIITPSHDLSHTTNVNLTFNYSYATNGTMLTTVGETKADILEELNVFSSKNCGETWTPIKRIIGKDLLTAGYAGNSDFAPNSASQWKSITIPYIPSSTDQNIRFKIEFTASDVSNNLYIDNINVEGVLGLISNEINDLQLSIYPNPLTSQQAITISYTAGENPVELILRDVQGKIIHTEKINQTNTQVNHTLVLESKLSASCYFLEVKSGEYSTVKKVVVL